MTKKKFNDHFPVYAVEDSLYPNIEVVDNSFGFKQVLAILAVMAVLALGSYANYKQYDNYVKNHEEDHQRNVNNDGDGSGGDTVHVRYQDQ